jgi:hypothetical protein
MGLLVSASFRHINMEYDSFYSRVEVYTVTKDNPHLQVKLDYYLSKEDAENATLEWPNQKSKNYMGKISPMFWDSDYVYNPIVSGSIDTETFITGGYVTFDYWHNFPLTSSKEFTTSYISESVTTELVEFTDFDEYGNEITGSREEVVIVQTPVTESVIRDNAYDMIQITGSLFEFAYNKVREKFIDLFGIENVEDL